MFDVRFRFLFEVVIDGRWIVKLSLEKDDRSINLNRQIRIIDDLWTFHGNFMKTLCQIEIYPINYSAIDKIIGVSLRMNWQLWYNLKINSLKTILFILYIDMSCKFSAFTRVVKKAKSSSLIIGSFWFDYINFSWYKSRLNLSNANAHSYTFYSFDYVLVA